MRWDSLNYGQQKRLMELYDQQRGDDVPVKPEEFKPPMESRRAVVPADGSDDPPMWWVFECNGKIVHLQTDHIRVIETIGKAPENWGND